MAGYEPEFWHSAGWCSLVLGMAGYARLLHGWGRVNLSGEGPWFGARLALFSEGAWNQRDWDNGA